MSEWDILVPAEAKMDAPTSEAWLRAMAGTGGRFAWEYLGTAGELTLRLAAERPRESVVPQLQSFAPGTIVREAEQGIQALWGSHAGTFAAIEFGLGREFMVPLLAAARSPHPVTAFLGAMGTLGIDELAVVQVLFGEVSGPWSEHILQAVIAPDGEPFFLDAPIITDLAREKCGWPLYAVAIRLAVIAPNEERTWEIVRSIASTLGQFCRPGLNELVPLSSEHPDVVVEDMCARATHRSGMILSLPELASLVRLPDESIRSPRLSRTSSPVGDFLTGLATSEGVTIGRAEYRGASIPVRLSPEIRLQHTHIIGATGTGKSTLIERMILDDIEAGHGVGVLDLHGDLIDSLLGQIPKERIDDAIMLDPANPEMTAGWNILSAHSEVEKDLLISDLVSVFRRQSTSWGDQMTAVLGNAVMAFLDSDVGGTLTDLRQFLLDPTARSRFLATVHDPYVVSFWEKEYPLLIGKRPQVPILTRLDGFLRSRLVRDVVTRTPNGLNFREAIDSGKIVLAKLAQGTIGEEDAALLGSLLVSKLHQVSLSRQDIPENERRPFFLYADEFQHIATPSMASLFSGLRKFRLGITVSHHDLYQLHVAAPEVERALLTNAYTRICFRVSDEVAATLAPGFDGFSSEDLTSLGRGEAICRVEKRGYSFRLKTPEPRSQPDSEIEWRQAIITASRLKYGKQQAEAAAPTLPTSVPSMPPAPKEPKDIAPTAVPVPSTPGRGGGIHKYLQSLVKQWGQSAGFKVEVEHDLSNHGRVDVALFRTDLNIACEIASITTVEQEIANVAKCLAGGFHAVIVVSLDTKFLRTLEAVVASEISDVDRPRVTLCGPEELVAILRGYEPPIPETRVAGYKVTVRQAGTSSDDDGRRQAIADVMLKSLRRMRDKDSG
ncbi:MAG TPA: type IV secretion system DNA-binding domain-containing protein [Gemmatimonadales bacterium]